MGRKSNYEKDIFMQLNELMSRVDKLESNSKQDCKAIKSLNSEVSSLRKENSNLRDEVVSLKQENISLNEKCNALTKENGLLRNDNERMKRILNNDSSNSSTPPSQDNPGKPANSYNGRKSTDKKKGAQIGHKGYGLSKADVEDKIKKGVFQYRIKEVGTFVPGRAYVTRYKLDLEVQTVATEYRIYADENGKFHIPNELKGDVFYGENIKAIAAFLYSEGVVANDRICTFINSLSGDSLEISTGCIYNACNAFSEKCEEVCLHIENNLLNADEICTDATPVKTDGKLSYIRNFSSVLYGQILILML